MTFIDSLKETLLGPYNTAVTENGAPMHRKSMTAMPKRSMKMRGWPLSG